VRLVFSTLPSLDEDMSTQHISATTSPLVLPDFLQWHDDGEICLAGHRVTLENVCCYYNEGYSADMLRERFPTLPLVLIHKVIVFYLENRDLVDGYLADSQTARDRNYQEWRQSTRITPETAELRRRFEARQKAEQDP
jgi:uncharacterized protein (DUF433 family)